MDVVSQIEVRSRRDRLILREVERVEFAEALDSRNVALDRLRPAGEPAVAIVSERELEILITRELDRVLLVHDRSRSARQRVGRQQSQVAVPGESGRESVPGL